MSTEDQVADKISQWLEAEAPTHLPARVLRATFERTRTTRQQPGWRTLLGPAHVSRFVPVGLAATAVIAVLLIGPQFIGRPSSTVGGPSPETSPTPQPSDVAPSSAADEPSASADSELPVGSSHVLFDRGRVRGIVTIPAPGWSGADNLTKIPSAYPPDGAGIFVDTGELFVYGDPCDWAATTPETPARTVDEFVTALSAQASRDASAPVDITVGGYAGKSITLHVPDDAQFSRCDGGYFGSWRGRNSAEPNPYRIHQGPGQIDELWILDVEGLLTVIDIAYYAGTPVEHVEEMRAIVESISFE